MDEGHCGLPTGELLPLAVELLEVQDELVQIALDLELADGTVIADTVGEMADQVICTGCAASDIGLLVIALVETSALRCEGARTSRRDPQSRCLLQHHRAFLCDHDRRRIGIGGRHRRHHGRVNHP